MSYFETRPTGQTVARVRELETIRAFLTGQGLFSALDLFFTFVFIAVLFAYSWKLTLIVLATIPLYLIIAALTRPLLRERLNEKFNRGAESQQFLVEAIVGMQTIKAAAVEPVVSKQWEERLAAYVRSAFGTAMLGAKGQNAIQYVSKLSTAALLLFGAKAVIDGELTVGELVAFNMIAGQVAQPVLRLSQLWQDFQQVQVSVERLGDILNSPEEPTPALRALLPPPRGKLEFRNVSFRYRPDAPQVLKQISLRVSPGKVIGIVGPSGSGKSTLTKLIQRFYISTETITASGTTGDTFAFAPNFGHDTITSFVATGATRDLLQFNASAFGAGLTTANQSSDWQALLSHTMNNSAGAAVITDLFGDSLTLTGVSKTTISAAANAADFRFI